MSDYILALGEPRRLTDIGDVRRWDHAISAEGRFALVEIPREVVEGGRNLHIPTLTVFDADGTPVGEPVVLEGAVGGRRFPADLVALDDGGFALLWPVRQQDDHEWRVQLFDADGIRRGEAVEVASFSEVVEPPRIVATAEGFAVALLREADDEDSRNWDRDAELRFHGSAGAPLSEPIALFEDGTGWDFELVGTPEGGAMALWTAEARMADVSPLLELAPDLYDATFMARFDASGEAVGPVAAFDPGAQHGLASDWNASVALPGGSLLLVGLEAGYEGLSVGSVDESGRMTALPVQIGSPTRWSPYEITTTSLPGGDTLVLWETSDDWGWYFGEGASSRITVGVARFDPAGRLVGDVLEMQPELGIENGRFQYLLDAEALPSGEVVLNWVERSRSGEEVSTLWSDVLVTGEVTAPIVADALPEPTLGTQAADEIEGTADADLVLGLGGRDGIDGLGGDDTLDGGGGADTLRGGAGADVLRGGRGEDRLHGQGGGDDIEGGSGRDRLYGGGGDDILSGGSGRDRLKGGDGDDLLLVTGDGDRLWGGEGADVFRTAPSEGATYEPVDARLKDFAPGEDVMEVHRRLFDEDAPDDLADVLVQRGDSAVLRWWSLDLRFEGVTDLEALADSILLI